MNKWFTAGRSPIAKAANVKPDYFLHRNIREMGTSKDLLILNQLLDEVGLMISQLDLIRSNRLDITTQKLPTEWRQSNGK